MADETIDGPRGGPRPTFAHVRGRQGGLRSIGFDGRGVVALRPPYALRNGPGNQLSLGAAANASRGLGAPIPVQFRVGNGQYGPLQFLPASTGTGVFIPDYDQNLVHERTRDGGRGNTPRGDGAFGAAAYVEDYPGSTEAFPNAVHNAHFGARGTSEPELEAAQLIGIDLFNEIFNT